MRRHARVQRLVAGVALVAAVAAGCGSSNDAAGDETPISGPTSTAATTAAPTTTSTVESTTTGATVATSSAPTETPGDAQLTDLMPTADEVAELMGADTLDVDDRSLGWFMVGTLIGELPPGTDFKARDYWSLDLADTEAANPDGRTMGVGPVDLASIVILQSADEGDAVWMFDEIVAAEPEYTRWVPIAVGGAAVAVQAVGIPYEGEPDDEPAIEAILTRRDRLIVAALTAGSDTDAMVATTTALAESVYGRAGPVGS